MVPPTLQHLALNYPNPKRTTDLWDLTLKGFNEITFNTLTDGVTVKEVFHMYVTGYNIIVHESPPPIDSQAQHRL